MLVALVVPDMLVVTVTAWGWLLYRHFWDVTFDSVYRDQFGPERSTMSDRRHERSSEALVFEINSELYIPSILWSSDFSNGTFE